MNKTMNVPEKNKVSSSKTMRSTQKKYDCKLGTFSYQEFEYYFLIHS